MASGDAVVQFIDTVPPLSRFATLDTRASAADVATGEEARAVQVWDFDAAQPESIDYKCKLSNYAGGGLTFRIYWSASTATTGDVVWDVSIQAFPDDSGDVDVTGTYAYNTVTATAPSASGEVDYTTITFTDGADMGGWADGEIAIVRLARDADEAADTMAGDAELWAFIGEET